jgi:hypothetical protein
MSIKVTLSECIATVPLDRIETKAHAAMRRLRRTCQWQARFRNQTDRSHRMRFDEI